MMSIAVRVDHAVSRTLHRCIGIGIIRGPWNQFGVTEVSDGELRRVVKVLLEELGVTDTIFANGTLSDAITTAIEIDRNSRRPPLPADITPYLSSDFPLRHVTLAVIAAALVGAAGGAVIAGSDGILPGIVAQESALLIGIVTNHLSKAQKSQNHQRQSIISESSS